MKDFRKPKIIIDPILGLIDVTEIVPLMDTAPFQSLGFKYQLGLAFQIFPAATHTRKEHSLGAYARTKRLVAEWLRYGFIDEEQARNLPVFALYHDIGHGPFSHVTESLGSVGHNERGLRIVESLKDVIERAGFNYGMIHGFFSRQDPLYLGVSDKNLGMEKLDYLERDAFYTTSEQVGVEYLAHHVYFVDGKVVINEVAVDQAKDVQDFYIKMFKHVYGRKKSAILGRLIEKMTSLLVKEGLSEKELFGLTDFGLLGRLDVSRNERVRFHYDNFKKGIFPKQALEFKHEEGSRDVSSSSRKPTEVVGISADVFDKIAFSPNWNDVDFVDKIEKDIAELTGIPEGNVLLVPPQERRRVEPEDVNVYTYDGSVKLISEIYPDHFKAMKEYGRSNLILRVAAYGDYRKKLFDAAAKVKDYICLTFQP
ncbi:MAG: HD domain-containing protein [Candidatus Brennerbacteria bacterium]|nr:HD domain-containing protein [Candidatus Brennerbacteria bacterium]